MSTLFRRLNMALYCVSFNSMKYNYRQTFAKLGFIGEFSVKKLYATITKSLICNLRNFFHIKKIIPHGNKGGNFLPTLDEDDNIGAKICHKIIWICMGYL